MADFAPFHSWRGSTPAPPLQPRLLAAVAQQFIERHVAADVFTPAAECAVRLDPGRRVGAAGQFPHRLHLLQLRQRPVEQGQIEALREGQRRDGLGDLLQLLHPADAAAGAAGQAAALLFQLHKAAAREFHMHFNAVAGRLLADVVDIVGEAMMPSDSENRWRRPPDLSASPSSPRGKCRCTPGRPALLPPANPVAPGQIVALPDRVARQAFLFDIVGFCEEQVLVHNVLVTVGDEAPTGVNSY